MRLYHFTCHHAARRISRRGFLRPWPQPLLDGLPLVWLTDLDVVVDRRALGLEPHELNCDRTQFRYTVDVDDAEPWARAAPAITALLRRFDRRRFELDRLPEHWFITRRPVFALQDRSYRPAVHA